MVFTLAIDAGTTGVRTIIYKDEAEIISSSYLEHHQFYPHEGWVEQDPIEIYENVLKTMKKALENAKINFKDIKSVGITNQRETTVIWNNQGLPIAPAIVWQDVRTAALCKSLESNNTMVNKITGLLVNTYFSGVKLRWLFDNEPKLSQLTEVYWGTIDSWLIWKLSNGKNHVIDCTNASRTLLMNIKNLEWSEEMKSVLKLPDTLKYPDIFPSISSNEPFAWIDKKILNENVDIPINVVFGDQQAALFGQNCIEIGEIKNTYGTGCFTLLNIGTEVKYSKNRLLTTLAYQINNQKPVYALEGATAVAGAAIQWLRDGLEIISDANQSEALAKSVSDTNGVIFVPAFVGLYAPYWDTSARGTILGITRGTTKAHIIRAAIEGIAWSTEDLLMALAKDLGMPPKKIKVDGGAAKNDFLLQLQANFSQIEIYRPQDIESTARGVHFGLGIALDMYNAQKDFSRLWKLDQKFSPLIDKDERDKYYQKWKLAIEKSKGWALS